MSASLWAVVSSFLQADDEHPLTTLDAVASAARAASIGFYVGTLKDADFSVDAVDWRVRDASGEPYSYHFSDPSLETGILKGVLHVLRRRAGLTETTDEHTQ